MLEPLTQKYIIKEELLQRMLTRLQEMSTPFAAEPYPDGEWCVYVKAEITHLLSAKGMIYA